MIKTQPLSENATTADGTENNHNATEWEDYIPKKEKIVFEHGETEKPVFITLLSNI